MDSNHSNFHYCLRHTYCNIDVSFSLQLTPTIQYIYIYNANFKIHIKIIFKISNYIETNWFYSYFFNLTSHVSFIYLLIYLFLRISLRYDVENPCKTGHLHFLKFPLDIVTWDPINHRLGTYKKIYIYIFHFLNENY